MTSQSNRTAALIVVTLSSFMTPFSLSSVNLALPTIGRELSLDAVTLGWIPLAYSLTTAVLLLPVGRLADIYGRKRLFTIGTILFGLASLLMSLAPDGTTLIALRVLQGIGGSMVFATGIAILTSVYPANEKGRVLGFNVAAVYTGMSVGPFLGGLLIGFFGWHSVFLANVPLIVLILFFVIFRLKGDWAEARGEKFDAVGSLIYGVSLLGVIYGFQSLPATSGFAMIAGGLMGLAVFVGWEGWTDSPALNIGLFRNNAVFTLSNLAALINYAATAATSLLLSLYLQQIQGIGPSTAGLILMVQPIVQAIFSPLAGRLSDTVEPRVLASAGMGMTAVGLFAISFFATDTALPIIIAVLVLLGLGFAFFSSPNTNAIMSAVERRFYGIASAMLSTMRVTGQTFSIGIVMLVFAVYIGRVEITPQYYPQLLTSMHVIFRIMSVLCLAGTFASLARGKVRS